MDPIARHRTKSATPETSRLVLVNYLGTPIYPAKYTSLTKNEIMDDTIVPNFNARIRDGEVINNVLSYTVSKESVFDGTSTLRYWKTATPNQVTSKVSGNISKHYLCVNNVQWYGYAACDSPVLTFDCAQQARNKALANVDSTPYEFFEDLLELREVINFLRNPLAALSNLASAFRRKHDNAINIKDQITRTRALAELWNTYRFAMAPLVRSLMQTMEYVADKEMTRPIRRNAHGYSIDETEKATEHQASWGSAATQYVCSYRKICRRLRKVHASILYEVTNPLIDFKFALGLRLKDVPVVAWELVPLSFMIDRILDVKRMLQGLMNLADPNVSILAGNVTDRNTTQVDISCYGVYSPYNVTVWVITQPDFARWENFSMARTVWSPGVTDLVPPLTVGRLFGSISSILDLIALTISRFPR